MSAIAVIDAARRVGLTLRPVGDKIGVKPAGKLPVNLRAELIARKAEVLAILSGKACSFFWGHKPAGPCARCGKNFPDHLAVTQVVGSLGDSREDRR